MSSFLGHALTAGAVFLARKRPKQDFNPSGLLWLGCLGLAAMTPDLDYFLPFLHKANHGGSRISNSFTYSLIIPAIVCIVMLITKIPKATFWLRSIQITIAGVSHIILDYLVGVHPSPLFWPISDATFTSPIGFLPSAGSPNLTNYYFYRNLGIEFSILVPIYLSVWLILWRYPKRTLNRGLTIFVLLSISVVFTSIAIGLSR